MDVRSPADVTHMMVETGAARAKEGYIGTFFKAWVAGIQVCIGAMAYQQIMSGTGTLRVEYPGLITCVGAIVFPVGLIMIIFTGSQLLTAQLMVMSMAWLRRRIKLWEVILNWLLVMFGNLAGALCYIILIGHSSDMTNTETLVPYTAAVAVTKTHLGWGPIVLRGIGCNFLICTAVFIAGCATDMASKILAMYLPIYVFVILGFEHVVVNMYMIPLGMYNGAPVSVGRYIGSSFIPSFIGNLLGGWLCGVPMLFWHAPLELPFFRSNNVVESKRDDNVSIPSPSSSVTVNSVTIGQPGDNVPAEEPKR